MKLTKLEKQVIATMIADPGVAAARAAPNFEDVIVTAREFTGVGFLTELERSENLRIFNEDVTFRWGKVGARLNASATESGYVVYVDDGYITGVEGYTYGETWPSSVEEFELYELVEGMELESVSKKAALR